ncbi:DegT/DnrJ/EryC1/StrS family aminotransferase [Microbacterium marinilacus]|uniref:DegT/DnrJ/EryC1/StrS family aminotransferase n=1 Tax=Microbacterium marinilacus TaxID=415209 RepID=A0ABP7BBW7_9MICO|nr:DegT/DnrJ/EryC1/StrS family aminotransferase [Microbacterium marinilacus]MBY0689438.1 DegT/DnrJ/EryC1/StrS family aminotransferase [Microbacterium marinilacus]
MLIDKGAVKGDTGRAPAHFYESARAGMRDLLTRGPVPHDSRDGVLLPGYIGWSAREGSGVFDPVRESRRSFDFYRLHEDLSVDLDDLERALATGRFQYVVVIRYFGRLNTDMRKVRELTDAVGAVLVEDLAHGFFSSMRTPAASAGHVAVYSLHKQFAMSDGGMVVYRDAALLCDQRSTRPDLAAEVLSYDWTQISDLRRRNFELIRAELIKRSHDGVTLMWPELEAGEVPQTLPVLLDSADRDLVYEDMNAAGFGMVTLYHTLIAEARGKDATIERIARTIINFPVHQDVDPRRIPALIAAFEAAVERRSGGKR